jgi:hypothetical protein
MNAACSVIASNYAPQARYLLETLRVTNPELTFYLLVTDREILSDPFFSDVNIVFPESLDIDSKKLNLMNLLYDKVEFATALKPFLLSYILNLANGYETVTFLDPDIEVFASLELGMKLAKSNTVALTPHRLQPTFTTNSHFDETELLRFGTFNLGYICVSKDGKQMLEWWKSKLELQCTRFPDSDVFTDQKWINLLPGYFDCVIIRNSGYNVSSWNIDERSISIQDGVYCAGKDQIVFIHYSQMSGELAKGGKTAHWKNNSIKNDEVSQQLIAELTANYARKLQDYSEFLAKNDKAKTSQISSGVIREHQIRLIRMNNLREPKKLNNYVIKFLNFLAKLERSSTYRGVLRGIRDDVTRLRAKFKKKTLPF